MRFRKKPVEIEAVRWTNQPMAQVREFCPVIRPGQLLHTLAIPTLEGLMTVRVGDWIIKGVAGEYYPCRDDIFAATYEPVT